MAFTAQQSPFDEFGDKAKALLTELNAQTGPAGLDDWIMRAQALLTFAAIARFCGEEPKHHS